VQTEFLRPTKDDPRELHRRINRRRLVTGKSNFVNGSVECPTKDGFPDENESP
jgi:hypothetical protein